MEMSDDECETKKGNRILVDLRSQDRDSRQPNLPTIKALSTVLQPNASDMDMRILPGINISENSAVSFFIFIYVYVLQLPFDNS